MHAILDAAHSSVIEHQRSGLTAMSKQESDGVIKTLIMVCCVTIETITYTSSEQLIPKTLTQLPHTENTQTLS